MISTETVIMNFREKENKMGLNLLQQMMKDVYKKPRKHQILNNKCVLILNLTFRQRGVNRCDFWDQLFILFQLFFVILSQDHINYLKVSRIMVGMTTCMSCVNSRRYLLSPISTDLEKKLFLTNFHISFF